MIKGIGGIFFQAEDHKKLTTWYKENLGITGIFRWNSKESNKPYYSTWNILPSSSPVFANTAKQYAISYCVDDLASVLNDLKKKGVAISDTIEKNNDGATGHALDPEGNKIIFWQSNGKVPEINPSDIDRVTGLGGIFFKSEDSKKLNEWYASNLGIAVTEWGASFEWIDPNEPDAKAPANTAWSIFKSDSKHFEPSEKKFMLNYRVKSLAGLLKNLEAKGVTIVKNIEEYPYGNFAWILDPENNKIELWEPKDEGFSS